MKVNRAFLTLLISATGICLMLACTTFPQQKQMRSLARVYDRPYDTVYGSVEQLLRRDLRCALKKNDRDDGLLETEWVHRIDTEGKKRWMVRASVREVESGTEVVFYKKHDLQDDVSKSLERYKKPKQEPSATSGWKKTPVDLASIGELYGRLEEKLALQE